MKKTLLALCAIMLSIVLNAQILRQQTSPQTIANEIPGFSQVSLINTVNIAYTPATPISYPDPVDGDTTTENPDIYDYGSILPVNFSISDGNITSTSLGKIWTLRISIPNALSIGLTFTQFNLSQSAEMYIYNDAQTVLNYQIKKEHFSNSDVVSVGSINGNAIVIYVIEPNNFGNFQSTLNIGEVIAGYQPIEDVGGANNNARYGTGCMPDIRCYPQYMASAKAVARIAIPLSPIRVGYGTGTLINNERNDGRAYLLTAFHVVDWNDNGIIEADELNRLARTNFQFQFWRIECNSYTNNRFVEFTGAVVRASNHASDMALLELINPPGIGDGVTYAGWSRQTSAPSNSDSYVIHHPEGKNMRLTQTRDVGSYLNANFWYASYSSGAATFGSSGSALFNETGRIVGQLKGGWSSCLTPRWSDRYGKFYRSWDDGNLGQWLSPNQSLFTTDLFDPATIAIIGSDVVSCTGNTQYSLNYNLFDVSYVWEWSNSLQYVSGQGTSTLTVSPVPGANTPGFVKITITSGKGISRTLVRTKDVHSGLPTVAANYSYNGNIIPMQIYSGTDSYNSVCNLQQTNTIMQIDGATSVVWNKVTSNPTSVGWSQNGNDLNFYLWSVNQTALFHIEASNVCGTTSYDFGFKSINCGGGGGGGCAKYGVNSDRSSLRVVVPNIPAPCRVASSGKDSSDKDIIALVKIYDMSGRLLLKQSFSNTTTATISTNTLISGVYIVEISDGKNTERQKVVVLK